MVNNGILKIPKDRLLTVEILQCNKCKVESGERREKKRKSAG